MYVVGPGPAPPALSPPEIQNLVSEYIAWGEEMGAAGYALVVEHQFLEKQGFLVFAAEAP